MPKQMLPAIPPRRISRVSARKLTEILWSWSTTRESEKLPRKVMRWSVAMDPLTAICTGRTYPAGRSRADPRDAERARAGWHGPSRAIRSSRPPSGQLKLSPQAQELPALGLSIVKPCFSMVSAKSIVAPSR